MNNLNATFENLPTLVFQVSTKVDRIEQLLMKQSEKAKPQKFGFDGLLDYFKSIGLQMSDSKLQKLNADYKIPHIKFNGRIVYDRDEIDEWIKSRTVKAGESSETTLRLAKNAGRKLRGKAV